jgi:predicted methyltransferase
MDGRCIGKRDPQEDVMRSLKKVGCALVGKMDADGSAVAVKRGAAHGA